jgi:flagellar hook-associated protein 3 FlgL
MVIRVATFAMTDQMVNNAMRTEVTMANMQMQESAGLTSGLEAGFGASTGHVINLQVSVTQAQSYIDAATLADNKAQVMYSAIGQISDLITNLKTNLSAASDGNSTESTSAISSAQQMLQEVAGLLNTQYDGAYVFGGGETSTPPVDMSSFASGTGSLTTADTSYYQGNSQVATVRVSGDQTVSFGVNADNPAFEQVMRLMKFVGNNGSLSATDISSALTAADSALDAVTNVQANLGFADSTIKSVSAQQTDYQSFAQSLDSNLTSVDVAAITAQLSTYQAQLSASYSALAKIQSMNLASYLR